jgi:hypothetical protein
MVPNGLIHQQQSLFSKFFINNPNNPTIIPIKIFQCIASFFIILILILAVKPNIQK